VDEPGSEARSHAETAHMGGSQIQERHERDQIGDRQLEERGPRNGLGMVGSTVPPQVRNDELKPFRKDGDLMLPMALASASDPVNQKHGIALSVKLIEYVQVVGPVISHHVLSFDYSTTIATV